MHADGQVVTLGVGRADVLGVGVGCLRSAPCGRRCIRLGDSAPSCAPGHVDDPRAVTALPVRLCFSTEVGSRPEITYRIDSSVETPNSAGSQSAPIETPLDPGFVRANRGMGDLRKGARFGAETQSGVLILSLPPRPVTGLHYARALRLKRFPGLPL